MRQASVTSSRISAGVSAAILARTQWKRWPGSPGMANLSGSAAISAARSSRVPGDAHTRPR
jgi:hypothetical protein